MRTPTCAVKMAMTSGDNAPVPLFGFGNNDGGYLSYTSASAANYRPFPVPAYIDYWMYFHPPASSRNYKFFRHHANAANGQPDGYWAMPGPDNAPCSSFGWSTMNGGVSQLARTPELGCRQVADKWVHVQIQFVANGQFSFTLDGVKYVDTTIKYTPRANWNIEHQVIESSSDSRLYIDDFFIDNTWARVLIANSASCLTASHSEIQPATTWSATSLSVRANTGTFSAGPAFACVVDSQNRVSRGFAITIDARDPRP